jgi:hypothetical protein
MLSPLSYPLAFERGYVHLNGRSFDGCLGIPFECSGWSQFEGGRVGPITIHYVNNMQFLELEIFPIVSSDVSVARPNINWIRAKVGAEYLLLDRFQSDSNGWVKLRFKAPVQPYYQKGIQTVFVAWVSPEKQGEDFGPWLLRSVCWR